MATRGKRAVNGPDFQNLFSVSMSDRAFAHLAAFVEAKCGIKMNPRKRTMLESRLRKRLRTLNMNSFDEYCDYLFSPQGIENERTFMINAVTTNTTHFFRELNHFDYLLQTAVPEWLKTRGPEAKRKLRVWSAGCSTGEEPYSLAMILREVKERCPGFYFSVLATDICTDVLNKAQTGIYDQGKVQQISMQMKKKYLLRNRDRDKGLVRVAPELRSLVRFQRLNFMERDYGIEEGMDLIFCRNVLIYFDRPKQEMVLKRLCHYLKPGGYVFLGHAESLIGMDVPLIHEATTVYRKPGTID